MSGFLCVTCSVLLLAFLTHADASSCGNEREGGCQNRTSTISSNEDFDFSLFDSTLQEFLDARGFRGASAAVVHRDYNKVLHVQGYGNRNANHVFLLASVSKIMTTTVLSNLHYRNKIDMWAPIRSMMPTTPLVGWWARGRWDLLRDDFTIEQAFSNLSGMPGLQSPLTILFGVCILLGGYSIQSCGRDLFNLLPQEGTPGEFHRYGGAQWQVAGAVAEHVTGQSWAQLVEETFAPCNLPAFGYTNLGLSAAWRTVRHCLWCGDGNFCDGCYDSSWQYDPNDPPRVSNPTMEGGAYADAESLAKLLLMLLKDGMCEDGRIMSPELVRNIVTDRQLPGDSFFYPGVDLGYGMGMYHVRNAPGDVWMTPGTYASTSWIDLENGYGAVVLLESNFARSGEPVFDILNELSPILRDTLPVPVS